MNGGVITGIGSVAGAALVIGIVLWRKGKAPKVQPWLFLIAGIGVATGAGVIGNLVNKFAHIGTSTMSTVVGAAVGGGAAGALWLWWTVTLVLHMNPKGMPPTKFTRWIALMYPAVTIVTWGLGIGAILGLLNNVASEGGNLFADILKNVMRNWG